MKTTGLATSLAALILSACSQAPQTITRTHHFPWEKDIGYTQVVQVDNRLYLSGLTSPEATLEAQLADIYQTLENLLSAHGAGLEDIIKEVVYTTDIEGLKALIPERRAYFPNGQYPASSWVEVERLFMPEHQLEIEVIAIIP